MKRGAISKDNNCNSLYYMFSDAKDFLSHPPLTHKAGVPILWYETTKNAFTPNKG